MMNSQLIEQCLVAAKHRGKEYAILYHRSHALEFVEAYDDFEEMQRARRWWKKKKYVPYGTWVLQK